jgi:hypothetical protein
MTETIDKKRGGFRSPTNDALFIPQIASLLALGKTATEIARQLNLGFHTVKRISQKDECKAIVAEITTSYKETAKAVAAKAVSEMTELAVEGLKKALEEGNVQAVRTHFQVIGLLGVEEQGSKDKGSGALTIVMPGASVSQNEVIEVSDGQVELRPYNPNDNNP